MNTLTQTQPRGYRKRVTFLLFLVLLFRFWVGQTFELTGMEAYTWMKGVHLNFWYWDQLPLLPWITGAGVYLFGNTELGVRWFASVIYCGSGFFLFYAARCWFNSRVGFYALLFFLLTPIFAWKMLLMTSAGVSVGALAVVLFGVSEFEKRKNYYWYIVTGLGSGGAFFTSWQNISWVLPLWVYLFLREKKGDHKIRKAFFVGLFMQVLLVLPILIWYKVEEGLWKIHSLYLLGVFTGFPSFEIKGAYYFLLENAFLLIPIILLFIGAIMGRKKVKSHVFSLLLLLSGSSFLFGLFLSCIGREDPYWGVVFTFPLTIIFAAIWDKLSLKNRGWYFFKITVLLLSLGQVLWGFSLPNRGAESMFERLGTKGIQRWSALGIEINSWKQDQGATAVITDDPYISSALSFYLLKNPFVYYTEKGGEGNNGDSLRFTQFDLWSVYDDFWNMSALLILTDSYEPSEEILKRFDEVKPLSKSITMPKAFINLCSEHNVAKEKDEPEDLQEYEEEEGSEVTEPSEEIHEAEEMDVGREE